MDYNLTLLFKLDAILKDLEQYIHLWEGGHGTRRMVDELAIQIMEFEEYYDIYEVRNTYNDSTEHRETITRYLETEADKYYNSLMEELHDLIEAIQDDYEHN